VHSNDSSLPKCRAGHGHKVPGSPARLPADDAAAEKVALWLQAHLGDRRAEAVVHLGRVR